MSQYSVYVIELAPDVLKHKKFRERNPNISSGLKCFYIGQTSLDPKLRFQQHKDGYKSNSFVKRYGLWLRWKIFERCNPISTREEALALEQELAERLQRKGYAVWWG